MHLSADRIPPFHPVLAQWFAATFGEPTDIQTRAWAAIGAGRHTLIAAPTGSGKTLAALLPCLDRIVRHAGEGGKRAAHAVRVLYITPLKALNNDIQHHVVGFAGQLERWAEERGLAWPGLVSEVRTGDTTAARRAAMLRRPPDLLVTTPESLFLLLTSDKGSAMLRTVEQVIVDEIHDLAADKRGAHLSLSLERLAAVCGRPVQRIGVSATQQPLSRVARFLGGWQEADGGELPAAGGDASAGAGEDGSGNAPAANRFGMAPRPVSIVQSAMTKHMRVGVTVPEQPAPGAGREAVWKPLLDRLMQAMEGCRTVLLFVNSRRLSERLVLRLNDHVGYEMASAHHGSLSRERRLEAERRLKAGELRCIVATSSLELGIDIGHIDLVIQIDSPLAADRGIQRIGRAGHGVGEESRGLIVVRAKALLPEAAVLGRLIGRREIEDIVIPHAPMDVLSQQTVALAATGDWRTDELLRLVRRSDSYHDYDERRFRAMLKVLAGYYPFFRPLLGWEASTDTVSGTSAGRAAAIRGAGTIPQSGGYPIHHLDSRAHLGELDEEFIQESRVGDVFQLGAGSWMIREIKNDRVYVSEAANRFSEVPFWRNEAGGRSYALGQKLGAFWRELAERLRLEDEPEAGVLEAAETGEGTGAVQGDAEAERETAWWLREEFGMDAPSADELMQFVRSQHRACGLPSDRRIVVEHYRDAMNQTHLVVHNFCGRRVNRAWLLALQRQFEQVMSYRLYGNAKDNGIELVLPEWDASWLNILSQVTAGNAEALLTEAVTGSPLLAVAFRKIAETSLLLSRSFTRTPMWQKRLRSEALLRQALPFAAQFPYLAEAMRETLTDDLGFDDLMSLLTALGSGEIELVVRETPYPSPLASQFMADYVNMRIYEGDGLDESTRQALLQVNKELAQTLFGDGTGRGGVADEAVAELESRLAPQAVAGDGEAAVAALLKTRGDMTASELVKAAGEQGLVWVRRLEARGAAASVMLAGDEETRFIAADERELYARFPIDTQSLLFILGRYAEHVISFTEADLCQRYPSLSLPAAVAAVDLLLQHKLIQRAPHAAGDSERLWSSVQVASQLVRLSVRHHRAQAEPADALQWCARIAMLQHALPGTQTQGSEGLLAAIAMLQGIFLPLSHWETLILPARVQGYRKEDLDMLCATGELLWIGRKEEEEREGRVAFFLAENAALYEPYAQEARRREERTKHAGLLKLIRGGGASFLTKLAREADMLPSELLAALLELAWEGVVSNDQFAPLRLHAAAAKSKRAAAAKTGSGLGRWYAVSSLSGAEEAGVTGPAGPGAETPALAWTKHLLGSYGMMNKELAARFTPFSWDTLYPMLRQLEDWGLVTRGAFIRGTASLQFAAPGFGDELKRSAGLAKGRLAVLSAADPANPFGLIAEWPDIGNTDLAPSRKPGNFLLLDGDRWLYWVEGNGKRVFSLAPGARAPDSRELERLQDAFQTILRRQRLVKLKLDEWNGQAAAETEAGRRLLAAGAERQLHSLVLWLKT